MAYAVYGVLQAGILERGDIPFSKGSSQLRDQTQGSCITGRFLTSWAIGKASLIAQLVKNRPAMLETPVQFLGQEDLLKEE